VCYLFVRGNKIEPNALDFSGRTADKCPLIKMPKSLFLSCLLEQKAAAAAAGRAETHFGALGCCADVRCIHYRAPDQSAGGSKIEQQQQLSRAACFILITSFLSGSKFACVDLSPRLSAPYTNFSSAQLFLIFNFPFIRAAGALSV
jgi:hypothetical protein